MLATELLEDFYQNIASLAHNAMRIAHRAQDYVKAYRASAYVLRASGLLFAD